MRLELTRLPNPRRLPNDYGRLSGAPTRPEATSWPVMFAAREAADARAIPAHHQPIAIVLDFVNPHWAGRRPGHPRRLARFDEAGGARRTIMAGG
jgi:hypothetical protein